MPCSYLFCATCQVEKWEPVREKEGTAENLSLSDSVDLLSCSHGDIVFTAESYTAAETS